MGGGKGGAKRVYAPKHERLTEDVLYSQAYGTIARQNPALGAAIASSFQPNTLPISGAGVGSSMYGTPAQYQPGSAAQWQQGYSAPAKYSGGAKSAVTPMQAWQVQPAKQASYTPGESGGLAQYGMDLPPSPAPLGMGAILSGQTLTGQKIPEYQGREVMQFYTPNIRPLATQAYEGALSKSLEGIQKAQQLAGAQAARDFASRGLGRGGLLGGQQSTLARQAVEQGSNVARDLALEQARTNIDVDKFLADADLRRQGMQAQEFGDVAKQQLAAQQTLSGLQMQQIGALGTLEQQAMQRQMQPYTMLRDLYSIGVGAPVAQSNKGDPFGALLSVGGKLGAAALCLPKGTMIERDGGAEIAIENVLPGDVVRGGTVLVKTQRLRPSEHKFYEHVFKEGTVIMSNGHPFDGELIEMTEVDHKSECTYDILTSEGYYYVDGVKLRSTLEEENG